MPFDISMHEEAPCGRKGRRIFWGRADIIARVASVVEFSDGGDSGNRRQLHATVGSQRSYTDSAILIHPETDSICAPKLRSSYDIPIAEFCTASHPAISLSLDAGDALTSTFLSSQALAAVHLQLHWKPSIMINVSFLLSSTPDISFNLEFQSMFNSFTPTDAMDDGGWIASTQQKICQSWSRRTRRFLSY
ncbi:hypothetical protein B0H10DRAFT_2195760 [Mycena sp. CBHHK59/15]|nr:hypothetical protein B0H10DRAFT_2195760 [Mycena sp. CBHHK59/15]